jgi:hypothetical protein
MTHNSVSVPSNLVVSRALSPRAREPVWWVPGWASRMRADTAGWRSQIEPGTRSGIAVVAGTIDRETLYSVSPFQGLSFRRALPLRTKGGRAGCSPVPPCAAPCKAGDASGRYFLRRDHSFDPLVLLLTRWSRVRDPDGPPAIPPRYAAPCLSRFARSGNRRGAPVGLRPKDRLAPRDGGYDRPRSVAH